jgi:hypothetical protein
MKNRNEMGHNAPTFVKATQNSSIFIKITTLNSSIHSSKSYNKHQKVVIEPP